VTTTTATTTTTASPPPGTILFRGDYDAGNFSQWEGHQWSRNNDQGYTCADVGDSSANIVSSPVQGHFAAKYSVYTSSCTSTAQRSEVYAPVASTGGYGGQDWYYGWWTMFPAAGNELGFWPTYADWNTFTDWHNPGSCDSNVGLGIDNTSGTPQMFFEDLSFAAGSCHTVTSWQPKVEWPLQYDHWYDIVLHVKWSTDPSVGYTELWVDGQQKLPLTQGQTMADVADASVYWKQGFYRSAFSGLNTVYHDAARRADSLAAVQH
jgi:hypothetical protein